MQASNLILPITCTNLWLPCFIHFSILPDDSFQPFLSNANAFFHILTLIRGPCFAVHWKYCSDRRELPHASPTCCLPRWNHWWTPHASIESCPSTGVLDPIPSHLLRDRAWANPPLSYIFKISLSSGLIPLAHKYAGFFFHLKKISLPLFPYRHQLSFVRGCRDCLYL